MLPLLSVAAALASSYPAECAPPREGAAVVVDERFADVTLERYLDAFFSERFNAALADRLGMSAREVVHDVVRPDGVRERRVRMRLDVPSPALRAFASGDQLAYEEVTTFDPRTNELRFFIASAACDRVKYGGTMRFTSEGTGVRVRAEALFDVDAPLLDGVLEGLALAAMRDAYAKMGAAMQRWLDAERARPLQKRPA